jgi:hypothetical protein
MEKYSVNYNKLIQEILTSKVNNPAKIVHFNFHNYSFSNCLLAFFQGAKGQIATFETWKKAGRIVKRGEKAKYLVQPFVKKNKDGKEERDQVIFAFRNRWFSLEQTERLDGKEDFEALQAIPSFDKNKAFAKLGIEQLPYQKDPNFAFGYARKTEHGFGIALNPLADVDSVSSTLFHELAHVVLGHLKPDCKEGHELREFEAELTSILCTKTLECKVPAEIEAYNIQYVQKFMARCENIQNKTYQRIFNAVDSILRAGTGIERQKAAAAN